MPTIRTGLIGDEVKEISLDRVKEVPDACPSCRSSKLEETQSDGKLSIICETCGWVGSVEK